MNHAKPDIFICHADDTLDIARALQRALMPDTHVFIPKDDLLPGDAWDEEVPAWMGKAPVVLVIVSPGWLIDPWAREVLIGAIRQCRADSERRVVPLYARGAKSGQAMGLERLIGYDLEYDDMDRVVGGLRTILPSTGSGASIGHDLEHVRSAPTRPALVHVPSGQFLMGSPETEFGRQPDEGPQREVSITRPFYLAGTPVTLGQYSAVHSRSRSAEPERPIVDVSWFDAADYCNRLSLSEGRAAVYSIREQQVTTDWQANGYRLPTEAEWEYACRAGTSSAFSTGSTPSALLSTAWIRDNSGGECPAVGKRPPNAFGLYDMHGTVREWCYDWHGAFIECAVGDPHGPSVGRKRILRGGSFRTDALGCRSAARLAWKPRARIDDVGFRILRQISR